MHRELKRSRGGVFLPLTASILIALLTSGCPGHQFEVSRSELERLVRLPPEQRAQNIYSVQQFSTASEPTRAEPWMPPEGAPPPGYVVGPWRSYGYYWVPDYYLDWGAPTYRPPSNAIVASNVHDATPVGQTKPSGSSSSSGGGAAGSIKDVDALLAAAVVAGVVVGMTMAITEGARYEGSVAVHPHHPVHLWRSNGTQDIAALDELTPEDLRNVDRATLLGDEGAGLWQRGSAPLNRKGFSYQFGLGEDGLVLPGERSLRGLGYHFALGYFPHRRFGLLLDSRAQFDGSGTETYYNVRAGLEAQWYPLQLWRLHVGPFAGAGQAWWASAGGSLPTTEVAGPYVSFGGLAELELTTRLGLTFRWGEDWLPTASAGTSRFTHAWSLGLAVY